MNYLEQLKNNNINNTKILEEKQQKISTGDINGGGTANKRPLFFTEWGVGGGIVSV